MNKRPRLLVLWSSFNFEDFYLKSFHQHPDFEIELVSSQGPIENRATYRRLYQLGQRLRRGEFDLIVAGNVNRSPFPGNKGLFTTASLALRNLTYHQQRLDTWWAPRLFYRAQGRVPLAVVDTRDGHFVPPWDWTLLRASTLFFKRDLMAWPRRSVLPLQNFLTEKKVKPHITKLRPFSTGLDEARIPSSVRPMRERDIDLFLSGSMNNPLRELVARKVKALAGIWNVRVNEGLLPFADYLDLLQRAKLVVCLESYGGETWRQYEATAFGAVPMMNWPHTVVLDPLEPDLHAFYFSYIGDHFERQVALALGDPDRLQRMADGGRAFTIAKKGRRGLVSHVVGTTLAAFKSSQIE